MVFCIQPFVLGFLFLASCLEPSVVGFLDLIFRSWLLGLGFLVLAWWFQLVGLGFQILIYPALARGSRLFQGLVVGFWLSHDLAALASCWWFLARRVQVLVVWGWLFGLGFLVLRCLFAFWSLLPYS